MKVAEVVVRILESEGIEAAFGIPGAAINPVYEYLSTSSQIKHYLARHEEGAVHAADGYFRAKGQMAMAICTSGPAATNFVTGLYTAQIDSIPLIAITGQNVRAQLGKEAFQCVDIATIAKPVCKATWCITEPNQVPAVLRQAFWTAREGRPGPVLIDLPLDVQMADIPYHPEADAPLPIVQPAPNLQQIDRAVDLLLAAQNPVLIMGGGVLLAKACDQFIEFAEYLALPVITTYMGTGGIPANHPLHVGHIGIQVGTPFGNRFFLNSDLVMGIGCRFSDRHTGKLDVYTRERKFIHIDIEPSHIGRTVPVELGIVADAKLAIEALLGAARTKTDRRLPLTRVQAIPQDRERLARKTDYAQIPIRPQRVYQAINEYFCKDTIFTTGCGLTQIWSGQFQSIAKPATYLASGGAGTLGYDLPAAIGAKIACPEATVVAVMGDGGFQFTMEELAMACQHQIPIIVIIINNGYLSLIRQNQRYAYEYEYAVDLTYETATKQRGLDFVRLAEAFGAYGERITQPDELRPAFERAVQVGKPAVLDIIVEREANASMGIALDAIREFA
ncbi:MAG TPA: thiamine pyrophosphate-dependent enzyme [Anaerolineae bacterium]|nr:thiamine pyrophosphate-dependent enzyme [Anaerolineae bacterium]